MYVILLLRLLTMDSGCHRNTYMTAAQLSAANAGHALSCIRERASGVMREESGCMFGCTERLAKASTTRAKTYMTIFQKSDHAISKSKFDTSTYLLADTARMPAKHDITTQQTGKKGIIWPLLGSRRIQIFHRKHCTFINNRESGEITGMLSGSLEDELDFFAESVN